MQNFWNSIFAGIINMVYLIYVLYEWFKSLPFIGKALLMLISSVFDAPQISKYLALNRTGTLSLVPRYTSLVYISFACKASILAIWFQYRRRTNGLDHVWFNYSHNPSKMKHRIITK